MRYFIILCIVVIVAGIWVLITSWEAGNSYEINDEEKPEPRTGKRKDWINYNKRYKKW